MPHCRKNASTAPKRPRIMPSKIKGQRTNQLVAPHIFIMAISSRRWKVANLMVFAMIKREMISSIAIRIHATAPAILRRVTKPSAISSEAVTFAMPEICSTAFTVSPIFSISTTWMR